MLTEPAWAQAFAAYERLVPEQVQALQTLVRIPSPRGAERPAQEWIAARMRELGLAVELVDCDPQELRHYPTWTPTEWDYAGRPNVAGVWRGTGGGRSLILNAHCDTTSAEPVELWSHDPWGGEIVGNRLFGRGASDDKCGCCELLFIVRALRDAGLRLKGDLILETTIDEECSGNGSLALADRGYEADGVLMIDGGGLGRAAVAHPGHIAFRVTIHGRPAPYVAAAYGVNAIEKAWVILQALHAMEARKNLEIPPRFAELEHPIHANVYEIRGGEWVGSVAGKCVIEATIGFMPPQTLEEARAEIAATVAEAASSDGWLREHAPDVAFTGLAVRPLDLGNDNPVVVELARVHEAVIGSPLKPVAITGFCDIHQHSIRRPTPGCLFTPGGGGGSHAVDEYFDLDAMAPATKTALAFVMEWCGVEGITP